MIREGTDAASRIPRRALRTVTCMAAVAVLWGCASARPKYKPELEAYLRDAPPAAEPRESPYKERVPLHPVTEAVVEETEFREALARVGSTELTLDDCLTIALRNNRMRPVSRLSVEIAEAQLRQALSFYWPELNFTSTYTVLEVDPHTIIPESEQNLTVEGLAPIPVNVNVTLPEQRTTLADRKTWVNQLEARYPLFTGGQRSAVVRRARFGVEAALEETRRTDLELMEDVERYYHAAVLSKQIVRIVEEALMRMEVTMELTKRLYEGGSLEADKTDYLRIKVFVEGMRATLDMLRPGVQIAQAALVQVMGLPWETEIELAAETIPFEPYAIDLRALVSSAYTFSPDWNRLRAGLQAAEAGVREARSGHWPKVLLFGQLTDISNDLDTGAMTPDQKETWAAGVAMELPLFRGFRTVNEVREARARLETLKHQGILLREGLALQVKQALYTLIGARNQTESARIAEATAVENRELHMRAYQDDLVEVEDVIEAQLMEVTVKVGVQQALYLHRESQLQLNSIVGRAIESLLETPAGLANAEDGEPGAARSVEAGG